MSNGSNPEDVKPVGAVWRPVRDLHPSLRGFSHPGARQAAARWREIRGALENPEIDRSSMDLWMLSQKRAFAIETGQIEGLYLLRRGVTETLIAEGFEGVRGAHSATSVDDDTLKGLLQDQEAALEMLFAHIRDERPLASSALKEWHALMTRHQASATGIDPFGNRVEIPLRRGDWKIRPNNPRRADGFVHEYCPPEQVQSEIDNFLRFHESHRELKLTPELEAAWLHHEFVRIHPFQDGNGRISRLLMAYPFIKAGEFVPIISTEAKFDYIGALEVADAGDLPAFSNYLGDLATARCNAAVVRARSILEGRTHFRHGNGGVTSKGVYYPPHGEPVPTTAPETQPETPGQPADDGGNPGPFEIPDPFKPPSPFD